MIYYTLTRLDNTEKVVSWKSKGLLAEKLIAPATTDNIPSTSIKLYKNSKFDLIFINVYEYDTWSRDLNSVFSLKFCFLGGVKLDKNADPD